MILYCYITLYQLVIHLHLNVFYYLLLLLLLEIGLDIESTIYLVNKKWFEDKRKRDAQRGYILYSEYYSVILIIF